MSQNAQRRGCCASAERLWRASLPPPPAYPLLASCPIPRGQRSKDHLQVMPPCSPCPEAPPAWVLGRLPPPHSCSGSPCWLLLGSSEPCPVRLGDIPIPAFPGESALPEVAQTPQPYLSVPPACRCAAGLARAPRVLVVCPAGPGWGAGHACLRWELVLSMQPGTRRERLQILLQRVCFPHRLPRHFPALMPTANLNVSPVQGEDWRGASCPAQVPTLRALTLGAPGREGALPLEPCPPARLLGEGVGRAGAQLSGQPAL